MDKHFLLIGNGQIYKSGGDGVVTIGQMAGCDFLLPNPTPYEDQLMAKIIPNRDGSGWHILKCTHFYHILVNGSPLNRVHYLEDGDKLEFPGATLSFTIRDGAQTAPSITHVQTHGKTLWGLVGAIVIVMLLIGYLWYDRSREIITSGMRTEISESVYTLQVDSLQLLDGDQLLESHSFASPPIGSAFLTTDSLLVTARHCIQPWLNMVRPAEYSQIPLTTDWPVAKALMVETANQYADRDSLRLKSFMTITDEDGASFSLTSDDFIFNTDFDEIVELGDFNTTQFWRSISHRYTREDMMLGDVAVARMDRPGTIPLASEEDIHRLAKPATKLTFVGHPQTSIGGNRLDFKTDELHTPLRETNGLPGRLFLLSHDGALIHGFSGGPVLVRDGLGFKAIGVISVVDGMNANRSYSVPTSEVILLNVNP